MERRVSFNRSVKVFLIPSRIDAGRRKLSLAESLRSIVKSMNIIDSNLLGVEGEDDPRNRALTFERTSPMAKALVEDPTVKYIMSNVEISDVQYDAANLRDKVAIDFLKAIVRGVSSKGFPPEERSVFNTLHILLNPSPDDLIGNMEHSIMVYTTEYRAHNSVPAFQLFLDVYMDVRA